LHCKLSAARRWQDPVGSERATMAVGVALLAATMLLRAPTQRPIYDRLTFEAGTVYSARFASDGQSIVYGAAWNGKPVQLFSTVGNSLLSQPLDLEKANLLAVSPSNELAVVLNGTHNGQLETVDGTLARAPLAGGSPREVLPDVRWADWDAHGQLAVVHYAEGRSRLEYPIGHVLYQSSGWISNIRLSPQGDRIAFMDHPALWDTRGVISVVDLSGHFHTLSSDWKSEDGLAWRPDGKEIWFTAVEHGHDLNLMAVDLTGKLRTILDLPVGITLQDIAPDGRVLVALDSRRLATAFMALGDTHDVDLSWHDWNSARDISPDGKSILFEDASEVSGPAYAVVVRKVDGSLPMRLGEGSSGGFSPDGKWAASIPTTQATQINLLPIGPGQLRSINVTGLAHVHNGWARFLPDGQRLTVNGDETGHAARCYVVDLSSGKAKPATPEGFSCGPSSPDGRAVVGKGANGANIIYFLDAIAPQNIPHLNPRFNPLQWSNDGLLLYGSHAGEFPSNIYKVEIKTGKETLVQQLRPGVPAGVVTVAPIVISRDGAHFAYSYNQTLSTLYLISGLR
jgi:eukaryotic-like serine/threonine-protein kinase